MDEEHWEVNLLRVHEGGNVHYSTETLCVPRNAADSLEKAAACVLDMAQESGQVGVVRFPDGFGLWLVVGEDPEEVDKAGQRLPELLTMIHSLGVPVPGFDPQQQRGYGCRWSSRAIADLRSIPAPVRFAIEDRMCQITDSPGERGPLHRCGTRVRPDLWLGEILVCHQGARVEVLFWVDDDEEVLTVYRAVELADDDG